MFFHLAVLLIVIAYKITTLMNFKVKDQEYI